MRSTRTGRRCGDLGHGAIDLGLKLTDTRRVCEHLVGFRRIPNGTRAEPIRSLGSHPRVGWKRSRVATYFKAQPRHRVGVIEKACQTERLSGDVGRRNPRQLDVGKKLRRERQRLVPSRRHRVSVRRSPVGWSTCWLCLRLVAACCPRHGIRRDGSTPRRFPPRLQSPSRVLRRGSRRPWPCSPRVTWPTLVRREMSISSGSRARRQCRS